MRRLSLGVMAVLVLAGFVGAATAQARLDTGFGVEGVAALNPPYPPGWVNEQISVIATGQNGETYVVASQRETHCSYPCPEGDFVFRYLADGALEPAFAGGRGFEVPAESTNSYNDGQALVAVDSSGLPVVARTVLGERESAGAGAIVVRRLLENGTVDTAFGAGGAVRLPCPCERGSAQLLAGPQATTFIVATSRTRKKSQGKKSGATAAATLIKLDSTGHRAKDYGARGSVTAQMPGEGEIEYDAITPEGATYFGGRGFSKSTNAGFLVRVSAKGKVDTKFDGRALKALKRLNGIQGNEVRVTAAVIGRQGPIELFGSAGSIGGFELRLNQNGTLRRGWAEKGLALLPFQISAAIQGREGSTMALTGGEAAAPHLLRITSKGKLDPAFGKTGQTLPGATNESGYSLFPAGLGRVGVGNLGLRECRQVCEAAGKLYRFLEGR
ncbi:MAG TPA: hypothetical protein VJL81_07525 [Solirubrobacterales bacterium]|nr:hypothetical protein [Solirubrobacterales bacterium]